MINSETPYKLAEIIRDTWPQLYRPMKKMEVTEHNITDWNLTEEDINELIVITREKVREYKGTTKELMYGLILGKLIIMKNDRN